MVKVQLLKTYYVTNRDRSVIAEFEVVPDFDVQSLHVEVYMDGRKVSEGVVTLNYGDVNRFILVGKNLTYGLHNVEVVFREFKEGALPPQMPIVGVLKFQVHIPLIASVTEIRTEKGKKTIAIDPMLLVALVGIASFVSSALLIKENRQIY